MANGGSRAIAVVGLGAVLPDAPDVPTFWENVRTGRYSITEVDPRRWDPELYYDPDPKAPDKTYSTIGGWVTDFDWSPLEWRLPIPPKVADAMDRTQKWSIMASRQALLDFGYPNRPLDADRTAVVIGNAMAGDMHYLTSLRAYFPEYAEELSASPSFRGLDPGLRQTILEEMHAGVRNRFPDITEDTMPGELGNIIAGRVANVFDLHGPNFIVDAACASALAAIDAAIEGLEQGDYDAVLTGGVDANMGVPSFIKFCKIGALSATGTRPYHAGADGFVMGEGAAVFLLKRLADAERAGDHIYAVIRGLGGSSDGKGKGITAPNPVGQEFALARAWKNAGLTPNESTLIEGHGTSTRVGDVVEVTSLGKVFESLGLKPGSIPLGSVKSNIGHLKSSAGAAGMLKAIKALDEKQLPPSLGEGEPNPNIDFERSPLYINKELREWKTEPGQVRNAGVSAFGFGGTNFHVILEEYVPGRVDLDAGPKVHAISTPARERPSDADLKPPLRGALLIGGGSESELVEKLSDVAEAAGRGLAPQPAPPAEADLRADLRLAIDFGSADELADKAAKALRAFDSDSEAMWKALRNQGIFLGRGEPGLLAFLYTGQGSQYVNMLDTLRHEEPIVAGLFTEADRVMEPILGAPLTDYIYADPSDESAMVAADAKLRQTEITQPAVLTVDAALTEMLAAYEVEPDMVMGHSLGEYGALVAARALPFEDALEAVAGRGREMANVDVPDTGKMAAVFAPIEQIERAVDSVDDYVVIANVNSYEQAVIGGSTAGVQAAGKLLAEAGAQVVPLPVSHAFHTEIVAPASEPLREQLARLRLSSPAIPLVANVDGQFYPVGPNVTSRMIDILGRQIASPVQFVAGLETLYEAGCRVFIEVGPKKALQGLVENVLGGDPDVISLFTNHPKLGDRVSFNHALCGLYAAGLGSGISDIAQPETQSAPASQPEPTGAMQTTTQPERTEAAPMGTQPRDERMYSELGHVFADFLERGYEVLAGHRTRPHDPSPSQMTTGRPVVVTGAGLGLPGGDRVFGDDKVPSLLAGEQFIDTIPVKLRQRITDKKITRLVKSESGGGHFETIDSQADVIKLAGRAGKVDLTEDFGFPAERVAALDRSTELAIGAGLDALRDAGIPLVMRYKQTTTGSTLPDRWLLPEAYRDTTGVIFASAFPGLDGTLAEVERYHQSEITERRLEDYQSLRSRLDELGGSRLLAEELDRRIHELEHQLEAAPYVFDRRFLFQCVSMGHAQMAEYIGARGPNTQLNAACASTTQAVAVAEDWIRAGRCERVLIVSGDDVTSDHLLEWIGSGFLAVGAAATDEIVEEAALPFDRRRHGMILGMGAAAIVVESAESASERGIQPISDVLSAVTANSAFHGSRLDPSHIREVMEDLIGQAERRWGIDRHRIAPHMVFVSHETYTPARGGSAQAEIDALRHVFGGSADQIVIANTKGYTGHAMGVGVEDVLAIKALETGIVPPVPNFKEPDPDLGSLTLSRGGSYPVEYALRLGAGFGSQISMTLYRHVPPLAGVHPEPDRLGYETRLADPDAWRRWLGAATGAPDADVEIERRTLRVKDGGLGSRMAAASVAAAPPAAVPAPARPAGAPLAPAPSVTTERPAPAPAESAAPSDPVAERVLEIVATQTGYPSDMLDLDLDLEADLGIDTVKQAETFAAIRSEYDIERDDNLALRDYPTLGHVIGFVHTKRPDLTPTTPPPPAAGPAATEPAATPDGTDPVATKVLEIVATQTGYPSDMLDLDLDLEADLGIDTVKQAETFAAIRSEYDIERDDNLALRDYPTLGHVIGFVHTKRPDLTPTTPPPPAAGHAATTEPAATEPAATPDGTDPVATKVLEIVATQTGYPSDMLDLDLDLEADLGIDTVKQAETFAAIRSEYDIERDDNLALRDYPTLGHVIGFVHTKRPDLTPTTPPPPAAGHAATTEPAATEPAATPDGTDPVATKVLEIVATQTGYPSDMLDLDLDLEADLGIDTVKQAETFAAIRSEYDIERDDNLALRDYPTLGHVIGFVHTKRPDLTPTTPPPPAAGHAATTEPAATPDGTDPVATKVLEIVATQTGYPSDMLDLDLDLEADLGIDTVKQAETFAAIRSEYDIERDDNLALRDYPTLGHVIGFVHTKRPDLTPTTTTQPAATPPTSPTGATPAASGLIEGDDEAAASVPRRIPSPVLRPRLDQCLPTGVLLDDTSRVVVMMDHGGVGRALAKLLGRRGATVMTIDDAPTTEELRERLDAFAGEGDVTGVYWLPALDIEPEIEELDLEAWREHLRIRVKLLYETMRHLYDRVGGESTFLVSATRLGGLHGYGPDGSTAPMGGAVTGFTKAFKREKPDALVKAVDFASSRKTKALAEVLLEETLADPGAVEVGTRDDRRWAIALVEEDLPSEPAGLDLDSDSVFVITGAAGSIVSAITADLARASGGTFHLLDLIPEPDRTDPDLIAFTSDREGLKRTIFERLKESGERATPAMVERELAGIERREAALAAIRAVEAAGGTVHYHSVNLLDAEGVGAAMQRVSEISGKVDVLLHAGGLEISRQLPDKEPREFDLVFDVKADGWFNLMHGLGDTRVGSTVVFSSVAGRFGNNGQTDYSSANDLLCKFTAHHRNVGADTLGVAIDWTAWGDIGMATRGSIPTVMAAAGIDMLPAASGIPIVRREVTGRAIGGEQVVGLRLGVLTGEFHPRGGLDPDAFTAELDRSVMTGSVDGFDLYNGLVVTTELDPTQQPFLFDHRIDGVAVLPGVMGIEAMAATAALPFPDLSVTAVEDVDFLAPFKFYRDEPRTLRIEALYTLEGDDVIATCRIIGERLLTGQTEPQVTIHHSGRVRLSDRAPDPAGAEPPDPTGDAANDDAVYAVYFHGPTYQVLDQTWVADGVAAGAFATDLPPNHAPADAGLVTSPRLTELAFQTAGIWEIGNTGTMALPTHIDSIEYRPGASEVGSVALVEPGVEGFDAAVVGPDGSGLVRMNGYRTVAMPAPLDESASAPLRRAMTKGT